MNLRDDDDADGLNRAGEFGPRRIESIFGFCLDVRSIGRSVVRFIARKVSCTVRAPGTVKVDDPVRNDEF